MIISNNDFSLIPILAISFPLTPPTHHNLRIHSIGHNPQQKPPNLHSIILNQLLLIAISLNSVLPNIVQTHHPTITFYDKGCYGIFVDEVD